MYEFDPIQPDPQAMALLTLLAMGPQVQGMPPKYHTLKLHTGDIPATHLAGSNNPPLTNTLHIDLLILPQMERAGRVVARHLTPDIPAVPPGATGFSHWAQCLQLLPVQVHQVGNLQHDPQGVLQLPGLWYSPLTVHTVLPPSSVD